MQEPIVRNFLFGTLTQQDLEKGIYEHGALRKVSVWAYNIVSVIALLTAFYFSLHSVIIMKQLWETYKSLYHVWTEYGSTTWMPE